MVLLSSGCCSVIKSIHDICNLAVHSRNSQSKPLQSREELNIFTDKKSMGMSLYKINREKIKTELYTIKKMYKFWSLNFPVFSHIWLLSVRDEK